MSPTVATESAEFQHSRGFALAFDQRAYDRRPELDRTERRALGAFAAYRHRRWPNAIKDDLTRLLSPIDDVLEFVEPRAKASRSGARGALVLAMERERRAFWGFDREAWVCALRSTHANYRQLPMAIAYLLCGERDLQGEFPGFKRGRFCRRVFGREPVERELRRVATYLDGLGHAAVLGRPSMQWGLYELMLRIGSPLLCDLAQRPDLFCELRAGDLSAPRRYGLEQLARTLLDMGVMETPPFPARDSREQWLSRSRPSGHDVPEQWLEWVRRWFTTSTLAFDSRQRIYYTLLKAGRWLLRERPQLGDPAVWRRRDAAAWVAAVDQMAVGQFSRPPNTNYFRARSGGPLSPRTKHHHISDLGRFFSDLQEWEWIPWRFDPRRAFAVPRSINALIGPEPRVIADDVWAKLVWAGLNLSEDDLPVHHTTGGTPWYPIELVRALAALWLFAGLRNGEIMRLRLGSVRWQREHSAADGEAPVCLLSVPTHKTGTAFTKPVDRAVGEAIERWEALRPAQPAFIDQKTAESVEFLFSWRGARVGLSYINGSLIPLLCRKAGVPKADIRGKITSHRARATIATQLYNAKDPMSLFELQAWLGHSSPNSTQHYARITPTTLAKAYTDAGYFERNLRTIEVLLDREAIRSGAVADGEPFEYFDLGHGYCTYSFFEQCPHRMACARCDFYVPKDSQRAQLLEAKDNLQRMALEIPLTDDERAAVEEGQGAVESLLERLADVPTPAGPTPRALRPEPTGTELPMLHAGDSPRPSEDGDDEAR